MQLRSMYEKENIEIPSYLDVRLANKWICVNCETLHRTIAEFPCEWSYIYFLFAGSMGEHRIRERESGNICIMILIN